MGIGKLFEELGGAVAAEQAAEALDPNAGLLVKGAAAAAGFLGVDKLTDVLSAHSAPKPDASPAPAATDDTPPEPT